MTTPKRATLKRSCLLGACSAGSLLIILKSLQPLSITVVIFCWRILLISESMDHHDSEIMMTGASIETTLELWASSLREVKKRMRPLFEQDRTALNAGLFVDGLLGDERRKTGWMRAEAAGDPGPWRQRPNRCRLHPSCDDPHHAPPLDQAMSFNLNPNFLDWFLATPRTTKDSCISATTISDIYPRMTLKRMQ
jgi:hypothetical protein